MIPLLLCTHIISADEFQNNTFIFIYIYTSLCQSGEAGLCGEIFKHDFIRTHFFFFEICILPSADGGTIKIFIFFFKLKVWTNYYERIVITRTDNNRLY